MPIPDTTSWIYKPSEEKVKMNGSCDNEDKRVRPVGRQGIKMFHSLAAWLERQQQNCLKTQDSENWGPQLIMTGADRN